MRALLEQLRGLFRSCQRFLYQHRTKIRVNNQIAKTAQGKVYM